MYNRLFDLIKSIYGGSSQIPLHAPVFDQRDKDGVLGAIDSGFVSSVGKEVTIFEEELAAYTGAAKAVAVVNGTAALHLSLLLSGVKSGDYVLTQALTFIATANAIRYAGADPIFLDSDRETFGLSPDALRNFLETQAERRNGKTYLKRDERRISACVPVHVFGYLLKIEEIKLVCDEWGIPLIEDAAEALGSRIGQKHAGTFGPVGILSFNGNKIITTGGGGALLFNDPEIAAFAKHLSTTAKVPHAWAFTHDHVGYNYRMPNLNAALGCSQLRKLETFLKIKQGIHEKYRDFLADFPELTFLTDRPGTSSNHWLNAILVENKIQRDIFLAEAHAQGIGCRPTWDLIPELKIYADCPCGDLSVARELSDRIINLPSGVNG
jgi:perosamine synthetase